MATSKISIPLKSGLIVMKDITMSDIYSVYLNPLEIGSNCNNK